MITRALQLLTSSPGLHKLPVTALLFISGDIILSGEGSWLCINTLGAEGQESGRRVSFQIFQGQSIHGLLELRDHAGIDAVRKLRLLVYGGKYLRLCYLQRDDSKNWSVELADILQIDDWILSAACRPNLQGQSWQVALITAHDALWLLSSNGNVVDIECKVSGSNTILYSAHVLWLDENKLLVAAGTAFGDVILWSCDLPVRIIAPASKCVHYAFSAHEGSIFGIRISETSKHNLDDGYQRLLATSSDDRTIRIWDVSQLPSLETMAEVRSRSTGFGSTATEDLHAPIMLAKVMGHLSRIWAVRWTRSETKSLILNSFGEDASTNTWRLCKSDGASAPAYTLVPLHSLSAHTGKNIWSIAEHDTFVATGGADGAICVMSLPREDTTATLRWDVGTDSLKSYVLLDDDILFAVSQQGFVMTIRLSGSENNIIWRTHEPRFANYSVVATTADFAFACGSREGLLVYRLASGKAEMLSTVTGKTAGLFACCAPSSADSSESIVFVLQTLTTGSATLFTIQSSSHSEDLRLLQQTPLELLPGMIITSFICINASDDRCLCLIGSRSGDLCMMEAQWSDEAMASMGIPVRVHADAITSLCWQPTSDAGVVFTTSRDGTQGIFSLGASATMTSLSPATVHQLSWPFGNNIEGLAIIESRIHVWGFRNKAFVVYSITRQTEIMSVQCGGAHRIWSFKPTAGGGTFVWTKASQVYTARQNVPPFRLLNAGIHGREIKAVATTTFSAGHTLVATGAEDTTIRIFLVTTTLSPNDTRSDCLQVIRKHNTGIQHLAFSCCGKFLFSSGGFEEFFIWKIDTDCPVLGLGISCITEHPRTGKSDLRITSFFVDEESQRDGSLEVYMLYSDSRVALWLYNHDSSWQQIFDTIYFTACPTTITSFLRGRMSKRFITTATDGYLAVWRTNKHADDSEQPAWISRHLVHQSAINDAAYCNLSDGTSILITGGDDNAISINRLSAELSEVTTVTVSNAHAAAVTAVSVTGITQEDEMVHCTVLSAGLDQRLIMWRLCVDLAQGARVGLRLQKQRVLPIDIADCHGMELLSSQDNEQVLIAGIGLQVLSLQRS